MYLVRVLFFLFWVGSCHSEGYAISTGNFPPFVGEKIEGQGLATKIIQRTMKEMGNQTTITFLPWKRGFRDTYNGKYYGTYPYSKNKERQRKWHYSQPLYNLQEVFFSKVENNFVYTNNEDLVGLTVCKPIGYNLFNLKKIVDDQTINLIRPPAMRNCFAMLNKGRVDLVMTNETSGFAVLVQEGFETKHFKVSDKVFVDIGHHLIIPKKVEGGKEFIVKFDSTLEKLKAEGVVDQLISEFIK